jgi:hypothetical protein
VQYESGDLMVGGGAYLKSLRPFPLGDRFFSGAGAAYAAYTPSGLAVRGKVIYGSLRDHVGIGGYVYDPAAAGGFGGSDGFKPINTLSGWVEVEKTGTIAPGFFAGYVTNRGTSDAIESALTNVAFATRGVSSGGGIAYVWEVAPRIAYNQGPLRFALEVQATTAMYTGRLDANFAPDPTDTDESVTNIRGNFTVFLFF